MSKLNWSKTRFLKDGEAFRVKTDTEIMRGKRRMARGQRGRLSKEKMEKLKETYIKNQVLKQRYMALPSVRKRLPEWDRERIRRWFPEAARMKDEERKNGPRVIVRKKAQGAGGT